MRSAGSSLMCGIVTYGKEKGASLSEPQKGNPRSRAEEERAEPVTPSAERSLASAPPSRIHCLPFTSFMWAQSEQPGVFQTLPQGCQGTHLAQPVGGRRSSTRFRCGYVSCRASVPEAALRGVAGVPSREVFQGAWGLSYTLFGLV